MTKEEFDTYLLDIGGLNRSYREDRGPITDTSFFELGDGWYGLIKDLIDELLQLGWDKRVSQVKEKFGGLRFYIENYPVGGHEVISKYESLSYHTCEKCGATGVLRKGSWIQTLCDEHANGKQPMDEKIKNFFV